MFFAVSILSPEPLTNQPPPTQWQIVNEEWETHAGDWVSVMAIPVGDPFEYAAATLPESDAYRGMGPGWEAAEEYRPLIAGQFPWDQVDNALCVVVAESGANPNARNRNSSASGLFQIMASVWADHFGFTWEDLYVPELNVYAAARIWEQSGWQPWSPRTRRLCGL